jgi:hypothetical protein
VCEWLLFISGHELQFQINSNRSHTLGTWTTIRDKQQTLTHSWDMNYNSRLTAITHTLTRHELQFEINSNHSLTHGTWTTIRDKLSHTCVSDCCLSRIVVHVPWLCEWLLFISNCNSCRVSVWVIAVYLEMNSNHSHIHGTWITIRDKQQSLTHSRDMNCNSR